MIQDNLTISDCMIIIISLLDLSHSDEHFDLNFIKKEVILTKICYFKVDSNFFVYTAPFFIEV
jgi:hypothetical protein